MTTSRDAGRRAPASRPRAARKAAASSAQRFARRQRSRRWLRLRPALLVVVVLAVAGFGVWAVGFSSLLDARTVAVAGLTPASGLSADDVRAAAGVPLRRPLAKIDLASARRRVVAGLPPVKDVAVARSWPHEIRLEVTERTAVAVWRDGAFRRLVDADGVAFRTAGGTGPALPVIELRAGGADQARTEELRAAGARVAAALPKKLVRQVALVQVQTMDSVTLRLTTGVTVMWGNAEDSPTKARVLEALLRQKANVYDVSVPGFPTTKA
ncbi:cell division protein FtsQ/DivIB [Actinopolymorpha alba]|uniref:cell division protein FtsQ/DivIB n=1 Tax=Actinopolymorpha alba TaxID=533267 RepID=UPI0003823DEC|nr:FtsQ-type POTRA domain-containing protein [Actinopolymorpha alba]